jgi:hypothetical protein
MDPIPFIQLDTKTWVALDHIAYVEKFDRNTTVVGVGDKQFCTQIPRDVIVQAVSKWKLARANEPQAVSGIRGVATNQ